MKGFDEPHATVCYNIRQTFSPVVAQKRGGRVLRIDEEEAEDEQPLIEEPKDLSGILDLGNMRISIYKKAITQNLQKLENENPLSLIINGC